MALSTTTVAPWTILSSKAAIASALSRPSVFGIYVRRDGTIRSSVDPSVQIRKPRLQICLEVLPCHTIHAGGCFALKRVESQPERVCVDMVEKRGEPLLLPLPCGLPYAIKLLDHTIPALCPECALLSRVSLGPRPSLHRLRHRTSGCVRRLHSYYGGVRLLQIVHRRL